MQELGTPSDEIWPGYSQLPGVQRVPSHYSTPPSPPTQVAHLTFELESFFIWLLSCVGQYCCDGLTIISPQVTFAKQPFNNLRKRFPYLNGNGFDLLNRFLTYDPNKRITAEGGLEHIYIKVTREGERGGERMG